MLSMVCLEQHRELIEVLFASASLVTMFVVIYLNYRANKMAEFAIHETRLVRELENRPYLYFHIGLEQKGNVANFYLTNRGKGIAKNIRMSLDQQLKIHRQREETRVQEMAIFQEISFLAPQSNFCEYADMGHIFFKANKEIKEITGQIQYEDAATKTYTSAIRINLKALSSKRNRVLPNMHNLVEEIERIHRVLQQKRR